MKAHYIIYSLIGFLSFTSCDDDSMSAKSEDVVTIKQFEEERARRAELQNTLNQLLDKINEEEETKRQNEQEKVERQREEEETKRKVQETERKRREKEAKQRAQKEEKRKKERDLQEAQLKYRQQKIASIYKALDNRVFRSIQCNALEGKKSIIKEVTLIDTEEFADYINFQYSFTAKFGILPYSSFIKGRIMIKDGKFDHIKFQNDFTKNWEDISRTCVK